MAQKGTKGNAHKFGGRNNGPSRQRYWLLKSLEKNKIRRIRRANPHMTEAMAYIYWHDARGGRRMKQK